MSLSRSTWTTNDETGYWLHEGGYYPTSRGYDVNAEIEFFDGQLNTACYLNHGARDAAELRQAFLDQSSDKYRAGHDGPYPAGFLRLLPGTYKQYTQWVPHADGTSYFRARPRADRTRHRAGRRRRRQPGSLLPAEGLLEGREGAADHRARFQARPLLLPGGQRRAFLFGQVGF